MQEEIEHKTVNLATSTTKLSARTVLRAVKAAFRLYQSKTSQGKQSVRTLLRQNRGVSSVEISKTGIRGLERYAKKYGIDYAIRKDNSEVPPRYLVFFKAPDAPHGPGGSSHTYLDGSSGWLDHDSKGLTFEHYPDHQKVLLRWNQVEKYIDLMIQTDRYLSDKEKRTIEFPLELNAASAAEYTALKEQHPDTLVGFEAGGNFMFYGEDAAKVAKIINSALFTRKTALGEVQVTGFLPSLWARKSKELWSAGNDVYLAGLNEDGTHHQTKYLRKEDYLPIDSIINMDGRKFRIDGVDFDKDKVSLQDMALADMRMPIFREEPLAVVRELYEQQDEALDAAPEKAVDYKVSDSVVVDLPTRTIEGTIGYVGETDVRIDTSAQGYSWSNEVLNRQQFEDGFILDGHTRYRILRKHPFIAYQIQEIELANRYAALSWICQNQLGRRNLDPERKKFLMGKLYESEKLARGGSKERAHDENGRFTSMVQNDPLRAKQLSTCERIAAQNGVGAATVKRAEKYAKGVDAAEDAVPGAREEILTGRIKATDAEITALAKTPKAEIPAALAELRKPKQERQPRKAETASSKQTLSEISKSIHGHQRQLTAEERTSLKASIDNRYQERAVANGSLMMCEVQGAKEDFIRRWNNIFKEYPDVFEDSDCRKIIHDLTEDAVQYLLKIKEKTL